MTRVVFWNIENFGLNKIYLQSLKRSRGHGGLTDAAVALQRRAIIQAVLNAGVPEIIVVIEVSSGDNTPNALATMTGGMEAMFRIQTIFNQSGAFPGGWNLVPPLFTGNGGLCETVGILYRRQNNAGTTIRYFTGPNIWTAGGYAGLSQNPSPPPFPSPPPPAAAAYPVPGPPGLININNMLVPPQYGALPRVIPATALHNANLAENTVAARVAYHDPTGALIAFAGRRQPFMATFTETGPGPGFALQRHLTIFAVHSPPQGLAAAAYMALLSTIPDIATAPQPNETKVVGGDFNLNLLALNGTASGAYAALTNVNYTLLIAPTAVGVPVNLGQYVGYFSTHVRPPHLTQTSKFLWSVPPPIPDPSAYPGYGYVGSDFAPAPFYAIDNILVKPHQAAPYNYNTTIMNTVVGTPMNAVAAPADGPPMGMIPMAHQFGAPPVGWPGAPDAANYPGIGGAKNLTGWSNYRRIKNTSDHFAVVADV